MPEEIENSITAEKIVEQYGSVPDQPQDEGDNLVKLEDE